MRISSARAKKVVDTVLQIPIDIRTGITDAQANTMVEGLGIKQHKADAVQQIKGLYSLFVKTDCTMIEVCHQHACVFGQGSSATV